MKLNKGEVLAFKTDTVWGFGANPDDDCAIDKIYEIKKRDPKKPLILMSNSFLPLEKYIKKIPAYAYCLIEKYLPGGLTLIFEKSDLCSSKVTSNTSTVGVRVPCSVDFSNLINNLDIDVLATTSCNVSNEPPVRNYCQAREYFSTVATVIEPVCDDENENTPSTVLLCLEDNYKILRQGKVIL